MTEKTAAASNSLAAGDLLAAFDLAKEMLKERPGDRALQYVAVLSLARSGAWQRAERLYEDFGLGTVTDDEDIVALRGRLIKDEAFEQADIAERRRLFQTSAEAYLTAYEIKQGTYPLINAATLYFLNGDFDRASVLASDCLARLEQGQIDETDYYAEATRAEALFILGREGEAQESLRRAFSYDCVGLSAKSSSLRQLFSLAAAGLFLPRWLEEFRPSPVVHYAGHLFSQTIKACALSADDEALLKQQISEIFGCKGVGLAVGALAAGSDILIAETALEHGAGLRVVLPCPVDQFERESVISCGQEWASRFRACLAQAEQVEILDSGKQDLDDCALAYASKMAMGEVVQEASTRLSECYQLVIFDGQHRNALAGTSHDMKVWKGSGFPQITIPFPKPRPRPTAPISVQQKPVPARSMKAILFTDIAGFGRLDDDGVQAVVEHVFPALSQVVQSAETKPTVCNSWGDGLFLVFDDVDVAAGCAIRLNECFSNFDFVALGLPKGLSLRIGAHYAPVFEMYDPLLGRKNVFGRHVSLASRIEPAAEPGAIYASRGFVRRLYLTGADGWRVDYVGRRRPAKEPDALPLFALRQTPANIWSMSKRTALRKLA